MATSKIPMISSADIRTVNVKNDLTPATGITIHIAYCAIAGDMICYNIIFTATQALTAGTSVLSGLAKPRGGWGGIPAFYATNTAATGANFYKMTTTYPGELLSLDTVTANANLRMAFCYIKD